MPNIIIKDARLSDSKLTSKLIVGKVLRKYIKNSEYFAIYDTEIKDEKSILNIPLLATVLPLAWLTGSNIKVDTLDVGFKKSADMLQKEFAKIYPEIPFITEIEADKLVENQYNLDNPGERTGLLFSGGVDSAYSLVNNLSLKPKLVMIWGVDGYAYPKYSSYWEKVISTYSEFSQNYGLEFYTIKSNTRDILHNRRIEHNFHDELLDGTLWARLQHSLVLLPIVAPLSIGRFDRLLIASSTYPSFPYSFFPWGSQPRIDENIKWSNLKVFHDGYILKNDKILGTLRHFNDQYEYIFRVCMKRKKESDFFNCCDCEKCYRTMLPMLFAGIDLNRSGFFFDPSKLREMKSYIMNTKFTSLDLYLWRSIQKLVNDETQFESKGLSEFFNWFKEYELEHDNVHKYRKLYHILPYPLAYILDEFYRKLGIHIHDPSPASSVHQELPPQIEETLTIDPSVHQSEIKHPDVYMRS